MGDYVLFFRQSTKHWSFFDLATRTPGRWQAFAQIAGVSERDVAAIVDALPGLCNYDFHAVDAATLKQERGKYLLALADIEKRKDHAELQPALRRLLDALTAAGEVDAQPTDPAPELASPVVEPQDAGPELQAGPAVQPQDAAGGGDDDDQEAAGRRGVDLPSHRDAQGRPDLMKGRMMPNPHQQILLKTILPQFRSLQTSAEVQLILSHRADKVKSESDADPALWRSIEKGRPTGVDQEDWFCNAKQRYLYQRRRWFGRDAARRTVYLVAESDDLRDRFELCAAQAGSNLGDWALCAGVHEDTLTVEGTLRWIFALFDFRLSESLPGEFGYRPIVPVEVAPALAILEMAGWKGHDDLVEKVKAAQLGYVATIPDAVAASCRAIEHLARVDLPCPAVQPQDAAAGGDDDDQDTAQPSDAAGGGGQEWVLYVRQSVAVSMTAGMAHESVRWAAFAQIRNVPERDVAAIVDALPGLCATDSDDDGSGGIIEFPAYEFQAVDATTLKQDQGAFLCALAEIKRSKDQAPELQNALRRLLEILTPGGDPVDALPSDSTRQTWWLFFRTAGGDSYADSVDQQTHAEIESSLCDDPYAIAEFYRASEPSEWMVFDLVEDTAESEMRLLLRCLERDIEPAGDRLEFRAVRDDEAKKNDVEYVLLRRTWKSVEGLLKHDGTYRQRTWDPSFSLGLARDSNAPYSKALDACSNLHQAALIGQARRLLAEIREATGRNPATPRPADAQPQGTAPDLQPQPTATQQDPAAGGDDDDQEAAGGAVETLQPPAPEQEATPTATPALTGEPGLASTLAATLTAVQLGAPDLAEEIKLAQDTSRPVRQRLEALFKRAPRYRSLSKAALGRLCLCSRTAVADAIKGSQFLQDCRNRKDLE